MAILCWCPFLLLFANNALAIPPLPNTLTIIQPNPIPLNPNLTNTISAAAARIITPSSAPSTDDPPIPYRVPSTPILLHFVLRQTPLSPESMARTILQLQVRLRRFIVLHHRVTNDVLFASDDPYMSDPFELAGCFVAITHWPPDRRKRLTYGMVDATLKGVWEFLYQAGRYECADFYIEDDAMGTVGYGRVLTESPSLRGNNVTEA